MKTLNLVYPEKSDLKYRIDKFPDGQKNIVITSAIDLNNNAYFWATPGDESSGFGSNRSRRFLIKTEPISVIIKSRFNSMEDLGLIKCAVACLRKLGIEEISLYIPYLLGARSDRQFEIGGNSFLVDVISPDINALKLKAVVVTDVHSDVTAACINNLQVINNTELVKWSMQEILLGPKEKIAAGEIALPNFNKFILVSPDAGASKKIYKLAEQIGYKGDFITCSKDRDVDGKLTKTIVPIDYKQVDKDMIIIDDICDGGATFINIARVIKDKQHISLANHGLKPGKIYLIVTHGIFSKGFEELSQYFDGIYCTNSYQDLNPNDLSNLGNKHLGDFVKQVNIF
jgi:ribose-phosphate pyrophosphokinase